MPRLSILVPSLPPEDAAFEDTLASILRNLPADSEVLALHDGSYPDPYNLREVGVQLLQVRGARYYGDLLAGGLPHCRSEIVHVLRPGATVDEGWTSEALAPFADRRVASAAPVLVSDSQPNRILTWGITTGFGGVPRLVAARQRVPSAAGQARPIVGPSLWAAFYRRQSLQAVLRRFAGRTTQLLDLELGLAFRAVGWSCVPLVNSHVSLADPARLVDEYRAARGGDIHHLLARHWQDGPFTLLTVGLASGLKDLLGSLRHPALFRRGLQRIPAALAGYERDMEQGYLAELRAATLQHDDEPVFAATARRAA